MTCSGKPRFENVRGRFASNGTGQRWSGDADNRPHEQYGQDHQKHTGCTTTADTTDATGPVTGRAAVVPTQTSTQKGAVVTKLLAIDYDQTKEELEGQQESKAQVSVLQRSVLIMMEPIILGCVVVKSITIKAIHSASRFFAINGDADLPQK